MISDRDSESSNPSPQSYDESPHSSPSQQVPHLTNYMNVLTCTENNYMDTGIGRSKMISDRDSESSNPSPQSYDESPHSSPSQQVPHLTNYMNVLTCTENNYMDTGIGNNQPFLTITEQPNDHFRFRYKSEMVGTHGCLTGKSTAGNRTKTFPSVALMGYNGRAIIKCSLVQYKNGEDHPHQLVEDEQEKELCVEVNPQQGYEVRFQGMAIIHTAKKEVPSILYKKFSEKLTNFNARELKTHCDNLAKNINLNIVRLKFSARNMNDDEDICAPVFSEPIHNMKSAATNDLKICRMSRDKGKPKGGDDVFLFTEKINKKNIEIHFVELNKGSVVWTRKARFLQSDVHHQYAIFCRTPKYRDPEITSNVDVYVQLVRPSDGRVSESVKFTYVADAVITKKRKNTNSSSWSSSKNSSIGSSDGSIRSVTDVPETVLIANQKNGPVYNMHVPTPITSPVEVPIIPVQGTNVLSQALYDAMIDDQVMPSVSPMLGKPNIPEPPIIKIDSLEFEQLLRTNNILDANISESILNDYLKPLQSLLSDEDYDMECKSESIRNYGGNDDLLSSYKVQLKADSGRGQGPRRRPEIMSGSSHAPDTAKHRANYTAFYTQQDGDEVKSLVKELCEIIRSKTLYKKQDVKTKLERLFEIRLSNGDTFLHMTISNNILPSMEYIVKLIHSLKMTHLLNKQNLQGQTILHIAVINDLPLHVPFLLSKGCDPMSEDIEGNNVVHQAVQHPTCLGPLLETMLKYDLEYDLNATNKDKQTPLHLAAIYDADISAKLLLSHKASYCVRDLDGRTPLHLAAYDFNLSVVKILLEHMFASEVDAVDSHGNTALHIVCGSEFTSNTLQIVELLLQKGADAQNSSEHNEPAWKMTRNPEVRQLIKKYAPSCQMNDDDIKSEPEDDFESADEGDSADTCLEAMSAYIHELSDILDRNGKWRELAVRLQFDCLMSWFDNTASPTKTLLTQVKEYNKDLTSKSLSKILVDMGQLEASAVIHRYDV